MEKTIKLDGIEYRIPKGLQRRQGYWIAGWQSAYTPTRKHFADSKYSSTSGSYQAAIEFLAKNHPAASTIYGQLPYKTLNVDGVDYNVPVSVVRDKATWLASWRTKTETVSKVFSDYDYGSLAGSLQAASEFVAMYHHKYGKQDYVRPEYDRRVMVDGVEYRLPRWVCRSAKRNAWIVQWRINCKHNTIAFSDSVYSSTKEAYDSAVSYAETRNPGFQVRPFSDVGYRFGLASGNLYVFTSHWKFGYFREVIGPDGYVTQAEIDKAISVVQAKRKEWLHALEEASDEKVKVMFDAIAS